MLPSALRINRDVRQAELATLARHLFGVSPAAPDGEAVDLLIEKIEALCRRVGVPPRLADLGVRHDQIPGPREKLAGAEHERQSPRRVATRN